MIELVITAGFGNGTFNGTISDIVTRGYSSDMELARISSANHRIDMAPENRGVMMAHEDRNILIPPHIRGFDL